MSAQPNNPCAPHEQGFTLVEVLVAFVVSAIMLAMILTGSHFAAARSQAITRQKQALAIAVSEIERFRAAPFAEGEHTGSAAGMIWVTREQTLMADPRGLNVLALATVEVRDHHGRRIARLSARKLKRLPL